MDAKTENEPRINRRCTQLKVRDAVGAPTEICIHYTPENFGAAVGLSFVSIRG
jgi:hypothetical protein